ncbi:Phosphatidylinositol 4-phosphate 5-kinase [Balamuthia mandrillaris]
MATTSSSSITPASTPLPLSGDGLLLSPTCSGVHTRPLLTTINPKKHPRDSSSPSSSFSINEDENDNPDNNTTHSVVSAEAQLLNTRPKKRCRCQVEDHDHYERQRNEGGTDTDREDESPSTSKMLVAATEESLLSLEQLEKNLSTLGELFSPLKHIESQVDGLGMRLLGHNFNTDFKPFLDCLRQGFSQLEKQMEETFKFYTFLKETKVPVNAECGYFGMLPCELYNHIFSYLGGQELCRSLQVCTTFNQVCQQDFLWKNVVLSEQWGSEEELARQKSDSRTWKWLYYSRMRVFHPEEVKHGVGCFTLPHGNTYYGDWLNNMRHGRGVGIMKDGRKYEGEWENDMRSGFGTFTWPLGCGKNGGDSYQGQWKNSKRHGYGIYVWMDSTRYEGEWKEGKRDGQGKVQWPDGRSYVGGYKDGKMHGRGVFSWGNGGIYIGEYRYGKRHGQGAYTYRFGGQYIGEWTNGVRHGLGVFFRDDGEKYYGHWRDNTPFGWGIATTKTGVVIEKIWDGTDLPLDVNPGSNQ